MEDTAGVQPASDIVTAEKQAQSLDSARLQVSVYRSGTAAVALLFISPDDRGTGLRRYADAVSPDYRCLMVDMGSVMHDRCLPYAAEDRACEVAAEAQHLLPAGDACVVVGYCLAGVLAALVAAKLRSCCGLILVDSPMPGHPYPYPSVSYLPWAAQYFRYVNQLRREKKIASNSRHALKRKVVWHGLRLLRPVLRGSWAHPRMQALIKKVHQNEVWLFVTMPLQRVPIVHFVCAEQPYFQMKEAILGWRSCAPEGLEIIEIAGDHNGAFFRPNLPVLVDGLERLLRTSEHRAERWRL